LERWGGEIVKPQALFIAQPTYTAMDRNQKVWDDLPRAGEAAKALAEQFASHGFELGAQKLLKGGDAPDVAKSLDKWFAQIATESHLIFYWTGHGLSDGESHYLICRNSPKDRVSAFNAITTRDIGKLLADTKAEKILVILDACYSGRGADEIGESLGRILATRQQVPGQERAYAIIASAHPLEEAQEGTFSRALCTALFAAGLGPGKREWTDNDEFIHTDALCGSTKKLMPTDLSPPQYVARGVGQRFILNPRYCANLLAENVEERQWRLADPSAAEHFELAARGIEVGDPGWFFSGRKRLLRELVAWLGSDGNGLRIVTGPPGAGKSAVVGRLATLSDPEYRKQAIALGAVQECDDAVPPAGAIEVAVHAKGKTLDGCARALAKGVGVEIGKEASVDVERLAAEIGKLDRKITVAIDALDEAADRQGEAIASRLIVPLGRLPQVKVLVGSRRSLDGAVIAETQDQHGRLRRVFGSEAIINDLADEPDSRGDIVDYVRRRLESSARHRSDDPALIRKIAERVADEADGVFLYARIVSRTLQDQASLDGELPKSARAAFEQDLKTRFPGDERRVDDLLGALAWGEGKGLTRRVWPIVANALAQREPPYDDDDIAWVLDHAGWHIIEAGEDGQAVYRLAHQDLADHYQEQFDRAEAQRRIVDALSQGRKGADWLDCDKYLWRHLATHAAKAGKLGELIRDPGYLAVAEPTRLLVVLPKAIMAEERRYAQIYERVVDRLTSLTPLDRMPLIHMTAAMEDPELAAALEPPTLTTWRCRWARVRPSAPHRIVGRHQASVRSVALCVIDGAPSIISGSDDKTVLVLDVRSGTLITNPITGHLKGVNSVAFGEIDAAPVIV
jgi:hypothetical protein